MNIERIYSLESQEIINQWREHLNNRVQVINDECEKNHLTLTESRDILLNDPIRIEINNIIHEIEMRRIPIGLSLEDENV